MSCTVCQHPARQAIDQALIAGSATLAALGQQYNLSTSALHRHKAHLKAKVSRAQNQLQENLRQGCIFWLTQALEMAMQVAKAAQAEGNSNLVLRGLAQGTRLANIILKQNLNLDDRIIYEIMANPQWASQDSLLPAAPDLMSLGRQSLAATLSSPCPETPADAPTPGSPEELALMQQFLHVLGSEPDLPTLTGNRKPKTENRLSKREKGGKLPGYECYEMDEEEQYRILELDKKLSEIDLDAITRGLSPAAARAKEDEICQQLWDAIPIPKDKPLSEYLQEQSLQETGAAPEQSTPWTKN